MLSLSKIESAANFSHSTLPLSSSFSLSLNWVKYVTNFMPEQPTSFQPFFILVCLHLSCVKSTANFMPDHLTSIQVFLSEVELDWIFC